LHQETIIAGMGGQGVMVIGQLVAHAALIEDKNVVWFPAYGPETRGGTAQCTVIVSTDIIGSPIVTHPRTLVALNQLMLDKLVGSVKPEGVIITNSSLAARPDQRDDCLILEIAATDLAEELGSSRVANMVMVGAYAAAVGAVSIESIKASLEEVLPQRHHKLIPLNCAAIDKGAEVAEKLLSVHDK
jgi:2-oxoglutarate ferredoxin oxidoreductase subunit gamma